MLLGKTYVELFYVVRQVVRQTNETIEVHELSGKLHNRQVAWISPSTTKKISLRCIRHMESEMVTAWSTPTH